MSFEDEDLPRDVVEAPSDSSEAGVAQLARDGQVKDAGQEEKDSQHEIARKNYETPSSVDLPRIDLELTEGGGLVAKIGDKRVGLGHADDGPILAMDPLTRGVPQGLLPDQGYDAPIMAADPVTGRLPGGELSPEDIAGIVHESRERPIGLARPAAPGEPGSEMGAVGDRSRDTGKGLTSKPEVTVDDQGRLTQYKLPDGQKYDITYGDDGKPKAITITFEGSQPVTFEKNSKGDFVNPANPAAKLNELSVDADGKVTMKTEQGITTIGKDGSFVEKDFLGQQKVRSQIDADGTVHKFDHDKGTETVTKPGSHVSEVKDIDGGAVKGYEVRDDHNHVTTIEKNADGTATVKTGDSVVKYQSVEPSGDGLKLTGRMEPDGKGGFKAADKSTAEIRADGTEIRKDQSGKVIEITNSDGEKTTFKKGPSGMEATVTDGQGKVVEKVKVIEGPSEDGTYKVERGKEHVVERKADGTERLLDKSGNPVESEGDKLLNKFKHLSPEQQHQLRQDLADIDKLPEAQRKKVYEALDKIARNDEHPGDKIKLTGDQARELVVSLAHQIAHPESIKQGDNMTCTVASAEQTLARTHPEVYADMVARLATDGKYTTPPPGSKTVEVQADGDKLSPKSDAFGQRSYSSELFQNAAVQLGLDKNQEYHSYPPGDPRLQPRPSGVTASTDLGERVVDTSTNPPTIKEFTGFKAEKQAEILNMIVPGDKFGATKEPIHTPADLQKAYDKNGGPPLQVGINLEAAKDFSGMNRSEANHAVVITKIENGKVYYENPAGGKDHSYPRGEGVPIEEFAKAMEAGKMHALVKGGEGGAGGGKMGASDSRDAGSFGTPEARQDAPSAMARDAAKGDSAALSREALMARDGGNPMDIPPLPVTAEPPPESLEPVDAARVKEFHDNPQVKAAREKLEKDIKNSKDLSPEAKERMKQDMEALERRLASAKPPMAPDELAKTFRQIGRLLEAKDTPDWPIKAADRAVLAEQILHHAAFPSSIDQGKHSTCNVATVESRMFAKNPAAAAQFISDVALTGSYATRDNPPKVIEINKESLQRHPADGEESRNPPKDGERSYASQLFQVAAVNISHNMHPVEVKQADGSVKTYPPGSVEYRQIDPNTPPGQRPPNETGEVLVDAKTGEPIKDANGQPVMQPYMNDDHIVNVYNEISGAKPLESGIFLADPDYVAGDRSKVTTFQNEEQLKQALEKAKADGKMPVILKVNTGQEPFFTDSRGGNAGGSGGPHVVVITDFDPKTGEAKINNQWGRATDHPVNIHELFRATKDPQDAIRTLESETYEARKNGRPDYKKELELLRLNHNFGDPPVSDAEYDRQLAFLTKQVVHEAKANNGGVIDKQTQTELLAAYAGIIKADKENGTHRIDTLKQKVFASVLDGIVRGTVAHVDFADNYHSFDIQRDADNIYKALKGWNDPEAVYRALQGKSEAELHLLQEEFKKKYKVSLDEYLTDLNNKQLEKAMKLLHPRGGYYLPA
ncbi:MAG TPA: hypothetical protein V6D08_09390 [Candidatus Obscuribacterales bacterium]